MGEKWEESRLGLKADKKCAIITDLTSFANFGVSWLGVCGRKISECVFTI